MHLQVCSNLACVIYYIKDQGGTKDTVPCSQQGVPTDRRRYANCDWTRREAPCIQVFQLETCSSDTFQCTYRDSLTEIVCLCLLFELWPGNLEQNHRLSSDKSRFYCTSQMHMNSSTSSVTPNSDTFFNKHQLHLQCWSKTTSFDKPDIQTGHELSHLNSALSLRNTVTPSHTIPHQLLTMQRQEFVAWHAASSAMHVTDHCHQCHSKLSGNSTE